MKEARQEAVGNIQIYTLIVTPKMLFREFSAGSETRIDSDWISRGFLVFFFCHGSWDAQEQEPS
jgi:hypothetical protein